MPSTSSDSAHRLAEGYFALAKLHQELGNEWPEYHALYTWHHLRAAQLNQQGAGWRAAEARPTFHERNPWEACHA